MATNRTTVRVDGLRELKEALEALPKATGRNVLRRALMAGGEPIEEAAESLAPVGKGDLKRSHTVGTKLSQRQKAVHRRWAGQLPAQRTSEGWRSKPSDAVYVFVGPSNLPQATLQEFGSADQPPQAFMRPAWDSQQERALAIIVQQISVQYQAAVARIARKAARAAARLKKSTSS